MSLSSDRLFRILVLVQLFLGISSRSVSFNFDTGPILVYTNCSCGTYTFHESWDNDSFIPAPTYTVTAEDFTAVAEEFEDLTADNLQEGELEDEDLVFIDMILNDTDSGKEMTLVDLVAVLPSQESKFKFLPFKMVDIDSILRMTRLPSMHQNRDHPQMNIHTSRASDKQLAHWFQKKNITSIKAKDLNTERQNLLITMLFFTISFNSKIDTDERYEICVASKARSDVPFALERYVR